MTAIDITALALDTLPSVSVTDRLTLPEVPAVYIVHAPDAVLYVGRTIQLYTRWRYHNRYEQLSAIPDARISWIAMPGGEHGLRVVEMQCIARFSPTFNVIDSRPSNGVRDRMMPVLLTGDVRHKLMSDAERLRMTQSQVIYEAIRQFDAERWLREHHA